MNAATGTSGTQSLIYRLFRGFIRASVTIYFRTIEVSGRERIPASGPVVLVANHPNSIIDAFLLGTQLTNRTINIIAKDSIPSLPVVGALLRKCGVIGVARRIDHPGEIKGIHGTNLKAIETCTPHLQRGEIVTIFGEGISTDSRKLGIIKKGAIRIGYNAEEASNFRLGVKFVPVGINYSDKRKFRSDVFINVGTPFGLADLSSDRRENPAKLLLEGTRRLQDSIEGAIVNLEYEALGPLLDDISDLYLALASAQQEEGQNLAALFEERRRIAECIDYMNQTEPKSLEYVRDLIERYHTLLRRMHVTDDVVARTPIAGDALRYIGRFIIEAMGSLLTLYGWVNNLFPRYVGKFARRFGREREFTVFREGGKGERIVVARETLSAHYGGWAGALIGYPIQLAILIWGAASLWTFPVGLVVGCLYAATLVPSWRFSLIHGERFRRRASDVRLAIASVSRRVTIAKIRRRRISLIHTVERLLSHYDSLQPKKRFQTTGNN